MEQALHDTVSRAEAAEDRLLRSMARFSKISPLADKISAHRGGSATIACVESRNEMNEPALWETFLTASPVQYLKAELKTPTQTAQSHTHHTLYTHRIELSASLKRIMLGIGSL